MTGLKRILRSRRGFTLVELVVVLVILGVLSTVTVPALTGYIDNGKEKQAISETQACVTAATAVGAQQYAYVQNNNVNVGFVEGKTASTDFGGWLKDDAKTPKIEGDVALTEGSGQYYLHVTNGIIPGNITTASHVEWANNKEVTAQVLAEANVNGTISQMTYNTSGQLLYLVYTSADNIQVVYTNDGTTASVDTGDNTVTVPTPQPTTQPEPSVPPENVKKLKIKVVKVNSVTGEKITGASLVIKQGNTIVATLNPDDATNEVELPEGDYVLHEESAPAHYLKAADISFSVVKDGKDLKLTGGSSTTDSDNKRIVMKDPPVTKKIIFWAADTDKKHIDGIALKITGDLGNRDNQDTNEKEDDTEWISSSSVGHTLDIPLTPGKSYEFRIDSNKTSNSNYDTSGNVKVRINVDANGNMTFDGTLFDGKTGDYFIETVGDVTHVNLVFPKKAPSKNGQLIIEDSGITVTIDNIQPWPITKDESAHIKQGEFYYYDDDNGNRTFYAVCPAEDTDINHYWASTPTQSGVLCSVAATGSTKVFTDSTMNRYDSDLTTLRDVRSGDLYYHNGKLYMFCNSAGNLTNCKAPEYNSAHWIDLSKFGYKIDISIKEIPVTIQLVDEYTGEVLTGYNVVLKNPNSLPQNPYNTDKSGAVLDKWTVSSTPHEYKLVPGTYKLVPYYYSDGKHADLNAEFTVTDSDASTTQHINVKLGLVTKDVPVKVYQTSSSGNLPIKEYTFGLKGTDSYGRKFSTIAATNDEGIATFKNVPAGNYTFDITLPNGCKNPDYIPSFSVDAYNPWSVELAFN